MTLNVPTLPLTQEEIESTVRPMNDLNNEEKVKSITIQKPRRKARQKKYVVSVLQGSVVQFTHYFPQYSYLVTRSYTSAIETLLVQSIIDILRPFYINKNTLILNSFEVSRLCAYYRDKKYTELSDEFFSSAEIDQNLKEIRALVYSTTQQATDKTLVMDFLRISDTNNSVTSQMGHFVLYNLNLETLDVTIIDTLNSDPINSHYFTIEQFKKLSACLLKASNSPHRRVKSIQYKKTQYTQTDTECGTLALMNMFLSYNETIPFLSNYSFQNYATDLTNFRSVLAELLFTNQMPLEKIKIN